MEKRISYKDSIGTNLIGIISNPDRDKQKPIVILVHGFSSSKQSESYTILANELEKHDITSFRIDLYAHGESEGVFEEITVSKAVDGIINAYNYLLKQGYVNIGLLGSSFGGIASIMAAHKIPSLFALVLKCPVSNYEAKEKATKTQEELDEWKKKGFRIYKTSRGEEYKINYTMFEDFKYNNGWKVAPEINIPTLIVHGDNDDRVPLEQSQKLHSLLSNSTLHVVSGANHHFDKPEQFKEVNKTMINFIVDKSKN